VLNAAHGEKSPDFCCFFFKDDPFLFSMDLGEPLPLNRIHLHAADRQETVPHLQHADYALPKHMMVEGANKPDFSDAVILTEYKRTTIYDACSIIPLQFPETTCRYVRLRFVDAYKAPEASDQHRCIGFTEIELFSEGKNVAQNKLFQQIGKLNFTAGVPEALTDGRNHYGIILPMKTWLTELALRHDLEVERPIIASELNKRYALQKTNLKRMTWLASLLTAGIILFIWIERYFHRKQVRHIKERFAADLHDEIGANLHTIGLLSDMADEVTASPEKLSDYLHRIRAVTERSGCAVRHVTELNEAEELFTGLKADMQRAAERVVDKLEHDLVFEGEEYLQKIKLRTRVDLFLFYKECLINICRHSGATQLSTHLVINPPSISLSITDNGHGLPDSMKNGIPKSLIRRARLLKAKVSVNNPPAGGTQINLTLRSIWRLRIFKR
jgi:signal transduction histidine kinase